MEIATNKKGIASSSGQFKFLNDILIQDFYSNYYNSLTTKELDKEFNEDIKTLTKVLRNLPVSERKVFIEWLSSTIEVYLENKINREIENSLFQIFKL